MARDAMEVYRETLDAIGNWNSLTSQRKLDFKKQALWLVSATWDPARKAEWEKTLSTALQFTVTDSTTVVDSQAFIKDLFDLTKPLPKAEQVTIAQQTTSPVLPPIEQKPVTNGNWYDDKPALKDLYDSENNQYDENGRLKNNVDPFENSMIFLPEGDVVFPGTGIIIPAKDLTVPNIVDPTGTEIQTIVPVMPTMPRLINEVKDISNNEFPPVVSYSAEPKDSGGLFDFLGNMINALVPINKDVSDTPIYSGTSSSNAPVQAITPQPEQINYTLYMMLAGITIAIIYLIKR